MLDSWEPVYLVLIPLHHVTMNHKMIFLHSRSWDGEGRIMLFFTVHKEPDNIAGRHHRLRPGQARWRCAPRSKISSLEDNAPRKDRLLGGHTKIRRWTKSNVMSRTLMFILNCGAAMEMNKMMRCTHGFSLSNELLPFWWRRRRRRDAISLFFGLVSL